MIQIIIYLIQPLRDQTVCGENIVYLHHRHPYMSALKNFMGNLIPEFNNSH